MTNRITRTFSIENLSTRDDQKSGGHVISGYAAVFNSPTVISDEFEDYKEQIAPGAFSKTLIDMPDIRCLFNHNWENILGRTNAKTLRVWEDEHGLGFEVQLPNTSVAMDLMESMKRGDVNQCSFCFVPTSLTWDESPDMAMRTINECILYEVSIVTIPAYEDTEAQLVRDGKVKNDESIKEFRTKQAIKKNLKEVLNL